MLLPELLALKAAQQQVTTEDTLQERYNESSDFDADMDTLKDHLQAAMDIINSDNWAEHLESTENNFDVPGLRDAHDKMYQSIEDAMNNADTFYETMQEAS